MLKAVHADMSESESRGLTCRRAVVAHRCAGAASVLVGGFGRETQGAASCTHVVHVVIILIRDVGEVGADARLDRYGPVHHTRCLLLHLIRPAAE